MLCIFVPLFGLHHVHVYFLVFCFGRHRALFYITYLLHIITRRHLQTCVAIMNCRVERAATFGRTKRYITRLLLEGPSAT